MLTLGQAAKETGVSKPTLSKAIKNGRLSAYKNDKGEFCIDPSELFRVYAPASKATGKGLHEETGANTQWQPPGPDLASSMWANMEAMRERERRQFEATIEDLRSERDRLLRVIEGHAETVRQLTHQPQQPMPDSEIKPWWACRPWLWAALALSLVLLAVVEWYAGYLQRFGLEGWE
jgi:excisionase family DNA binding protein